MGLSAQNRLIKLLTGTGMRMKKQELNYITGSSNERGNLWSEDYPGVSKWMEAQTDRLDYDLRGWEPVEYEYLKVYPAVNTFLGHVSESTLNQISGGFRPLGSFLVVKL
ncbi:hypothetical protein PPACK8108_LOCUS10891 [Phakopsora pachyrhizi]|uniref:Uncharacterized protein n=1 Tax=Phakopsora pachyrhizi TaxID=170000 RepID=A0AAV0B1R5_PHAPC|nr:hypothetical protein PPACK8108_LOCUS10891 [Phakopsora pachyrhizi]